jgi:cysteinyl-tRNA synthetase
MMAVPAVVGQSAFAVASSSPTIVAVPCLNLVTALGTTGTSSPHPLKILDQSGTQSTWSRYVEFYSRKGGNATECTYRLPTGLSTGSITELRVHVNYKGPQQSEQRWAWALQDRSGSWVSVGDNGAAGNWRWTEMIFAVPGNPADYIANGTLKLLYRSTQAVDASDLDYQVIELVLDGTPAPATPTPAPTATTVRAAASPTPTNTAPSTTNTATSVPPTATATARPASSPTPTSIPSGGSLTGVSSWVYQLSSYPNDRLDQIAASHFNLAVVDLARDGSTDYFTRPEVAAVQASGKVVLAYFEIGAIEDYRPEWSQVPSDMKLGAVGGWPSEQYVKYWDERWWPIVKGRVDQAIAAGFNGAYLDMIVTYEEIPATAAGTNRSDLAAKMVDLIARLSQYAKSIDPNFKVLPQNSPELRTWPKYLPAIDGIGMEELYFLATDKACSQSWCADNRNNAAAIRSAGKRVLTIDYANNASNIASAYTQSRTAGFVSYASVVNLDTMRINPGWDP